jgi:hypothetical protein
MAGKQTGGETRERSEAAGPDSMAAGKPDATAGTAGATAEAPEAAATQAAAGRPGSEGKAPAAADGALLPDEQSERFTSRWQEIQTGFVDRPQQAVEQADALVVDLMQRVTGSLAKERERLESQWARGDEVSTEDLRIALTRYRSFFDRLLST